MWLCNYVWHIDLKRIQKINFAFGLVYATLSTMFDVLIEASSLWDVWIIPIVHVLNLVWQRMHDCLIKVSLLIKCWLVDRELTCWQNVDPWTVCRPIDHLLTCWPFDASLRPTSCAKVNYASICVNFSFVLFICYQYDLCDFMISPDDPLRLCDV